MAAIEHTVLQFSTSPSSSLSAKVHPLVIFNICDCYVRRPDQSERVIGTLLGSVLPDGTVDIRNSYAVPHMSAEQVALDIEYHHNMLISHQKVNPKEVIVGWYSTGLGVTGGSALFHEFYSREAPNPVHLTVDTGFVNGAGTIKAYVSVNLSLGDRQLAAQFQEIPLDLRMVEAERVGYDILKTPMVDKLPTDLEGMEASMERLLALIDDVYKYVDNVVEGRAEQDNTIGRFLFDTIASLPKLSPSAFDKLINDSLQDNLLLLYLSSITRTQLTLAEKLNTAAQETRNNFGIPNFLREAKFLDDAIADLGHSLSADCIWVQSTCTAFRDGFPTRKELVGQLGTRMDLDPILREIFQFDRNTR